MADALPDLPGLAQAGLGAGLLVWLYVRLLMHHRQDRGEARRNEAALRKRIDELQQQLEVERRKRWRAEDAAARYRRQLGLPPTVDLEADDDH